MQRVLWLLLASAACGPKVHPATTFDEDDPRAGALVDAGVDAAVEPADAARPPGVRTGTVTRAEVAAVLDAGPAELLRGLEVSALRPGGVFTGWRLVRFVRRSQVPNPFEAVDLAIGDVLLALNGHTLETPQDLSALWVELYSATAIDASIDRGGERFTLHFDVTE